MDKKPDYNWTLQDWANNVGVVNTQDLREIFDDFCKEAKLEIRARPTFYEWMQYGIAERRYALIMIQALSRFEQFHQTGIFSCENIEAHAAIFWRSKALKHHDDPPSSEELKKICPKSCDKESLRQLVYPAPPLKLFGRDQDRNRLTSTLSRFPIVLLSGFAGNGKTALAWAYAQANPDKYECFDWTTDKQQYIDVHGKLRPGVSQKLDKERIVDSMIAQFGWDDLKSLPNTEDLRDKVKACRERLQKGRFLVVIDNIETPEIQKQLMELVHQLVNSDKPCQSRILITSRFSIPLTGNQKTLLIEGIEKEKVPDFLQQIQENLITKIPPLTTEQIEALAVHTECNPLFLQIALHRYQYRPSKEEFNHIVDDLKSGSFVAFKNLFAPLAERIKSPGATELAIFASRSALVTYNDLQSHWENLLPSLGLQNKPSEARAALTEALEELIQNNIFSLHVYPGSQLTEYSMHSLIRGYFLQFPLI